MMWRIAWGNIKRNRRRSFATGLAITAGFVGLSLLGGYILGVEHLLRAGTVYLGHAGHISIYKKDGLLNFSSHPKRYLITSSDLEKINSELGSLKEQVDYEGKYLSGNALLSNGAHSLPVMISGIDLDAEDKIQHNPFVLKWAKDILETSNQRILVEKQKEIPDAISVTKTIKSMIGENLGDSVQLAAKNFDGDLNAVNATLATTHTAPSTFFDATSLLAPLRLTQELFGTDGFSVVSLFLKNGVSSGKFYRELQSKLDLTFDAYIFHDENVGPNYAGSMGFLYVLAGFFIFLICSAVALSIVNSLTISILERTKEIGTLKALGYNNLTVASLFAKEAVILTGLSCVIGIFLAKYIALAVNNMGFKYVPPNAPEPISFSVYPEFWVGVALAILFFIITILTSYLVVKSRTSLNVATLFSEQGV